MYKGFFDRVENIIKDNKEVSDKEKLWCDWWNWIKENGIA